MALNAFRAVTLSFVIYLPSTLGPVHSQPAPAPVSLENIGEVCSGIEKVSSSGGRGNFSTEKGLDVQMTPEKEIKIYQSGKQLYKIDRFTYQDYAKCVSDLANILLRPPAPEPRACRDPSHGLERYAREFDVTRLSVPMSGGHTRKEWCDQLIGILRGEHPSGDFTKVSDGESSKSRCKPLNCPEYTYSCTVHVKTDPIWIEKNSSACR